MCCGALRYQGYYKLVVLLLLAIEFLFGMLDLQIGHV